MKTLPFRKEWIEAILSGDKTSTLRARTTLRPGELAAARCRRDQPPFAILQVTGVRPIQLAELDPVTATEERITRIYPEAQELLEITFHRVLDG